MFGIIFSFVASQILYFALHLESSSFPKPLSARDEIAAFEAMKNGDMAARDKLIRHNLRLVAHIVKKYYASSTDQEDLISIGTIGLIKAVNSFDNTKGARFATYAARCIENEVLMYGVPPLFVLNAQEKQRVLRVLDDLLAEEQEEKFLLYNMNIYLAMQLHALYCRYAMERKKKEDSEKDCVWDVIQRVLLDTSKTVPMEEYAKAAGMTKVTLNRKIVRRCGYTFFQLQKMGKIFNACALLHFPDLNIQYISDYLGFTNIEDFYRVFKRYMNVSVREYQKQNVGNGMQMHSEEEALQILVYLILNFHDPFQMKEMEKVLKKNAHLLERRAREVFGRSVLELLEEVRIQISCSYLVATDRTVTQISSDVGFGSISSFQRSFFKYMNQTPSQFRCSMKSK